MFTSGSDVRGVPASSILWDLFGVFLPFQTPAGFAELAAAVGVEPEILWPAYRGAHRDAYDAGLVTAEEYWQLVSECVGVVIDWRDALEAELATWKGCHADVVDYARDLASRGVRMGLLSNLPPEFVPVVCEENPWIGEVFHSVTFSCDLGLAKPDHRIFAVALEKLGCEPGDVLFIDDSPVNVVAAREIGMRVHHFGGGDPGRSTNYRMGSNSQGGAVSRETDVFAALANLREDVSRW